MIALDIDVRLKELPFCYFLKMECSLKELDQSWVQPSSSNTLSFRFSETGSLVEWGWAMAMATEEEEEDR